MEIYFPNLKEIEFQIFYWNLGLMKNISASKNWKMKMDFSICILKIEFP